MVIKASTLGLRVEQAWIPHRVRIEESKVTGTLKGKWLTAIDVYRATRGS